MILEAAIQEKLALIQEKLAEVGVIPDTPRKVGHESEKVAYLVGYWVTSKMGDG